MAELKIEFEKNFATLTPQIRRVVRKSTIHALNSTIIGVRRDVQQVITDGLGLKRKDIIKRLWIWKAEASHIQASLEVNGGRIPLYLFGARSIKVKSARGKRTGATVMIKGARQLVAGGFLAEMKSGKMGVFSRRGGERLPIKQLFSNEVADFLKSNAGFLPRIKAEAEQNMQKNFERDYLFYYAREFGT